MLLHARETFSQQQQKARLWGNSKQEHYRHYPGITPCLKTSKASAWDGGDGIAADHSSSRASIRVGSCLGCSSALVAHNPLHCYNFHRVTCTNSMANTWLAQSRQIPVLRQAGLPLLQAPLAPSLEGEHPSGEPRAYPSPGPERGTTHSDQHRLQTPFSSPHLLPSSGFYSSKHL